MIIYEIIVVCFYIEIRYVLVVRRMAKRNISFSTKPNCILFQTVLIYVFGLDLLKKKKIQPFNNITSYVSRLDQIILLRLPKVFNYSRDLHYNNSVNRKLTPILRNNEYGNENWIIQNDWEKFYILNMWYSSTRYFPLGTYIILLKRKTAIVVECELKLS